MGVQVRKAESDDQRALARIEHDAWSPASSVHLRPSPEAVFFRELITPENVLVALESGRLVGAVKLVPMAEAHPRFADAVRHVQQIHGFSVAPEHHGRGAGTALLDAVRWEAAARGARRVTLRVLSTNDRAQALYRRNGYEVEGVLRNEFFLQGRYVDDVLMALDLNAAESPIPDAG